jgi:DNA-binding IclR family transcriptional regulator
VGQDGEYVTASLDEIRAVWAGVSASPRISVRCLVQQTGIAKTRLHHILHFLERAGYLQHDPHCTGRRVRIPLVWT